jgi:hypothetical protein
VKASHDLLTQMQFDAASDIHISTGAASASSRNRRSAPLFSLREFIWSIGAAASLVAGSIEGAFSIGFLADGVFLLFRGIDDVRRQNGMFLNYIIATRE